MKSKSIKFRSNFEVYLANNLSTANYHWSYESETFPYVIEHNYKPDFKIRDDIFIEGKGLFESVDRTKMLEVQKQHPEKIFIICFQDPNIKISKNSKTRYRDWAEKHNFIWCTNDINSIRRAINDAYRRSWNNEE